MAVLKILHIPDPVLKKPSLEVKEITPHLVQFIEDLNETMRRHPHCVGIAAPQVSNNIRIVCFDASLSVKENPNHGGLILINPVITFKEGCKPGREGCLSVPDWTGNVNRAERITVSALDKTGRPFKLDTEGFEAVVIQHEIDHLDGILFLDRVSSLKTDIFRRKNYK